MKYSPHKKHTVYPEDIECVYEPRNGKGGIYVGNLEASQNLKTLKKHNIKAVLTAAKDIFLDHPKNQIPYYLYIPGEDHERFNLSIYFDRCADFLDQVLAKTNVLVHCMAGISRSVSLVLAYMMKYLQMPLKEAFTQVRRKRKIINPNRGFIKQLEQFQKKLFNSHGTKIHNRSVDNYMRNQRDYSQTNLKNNLYQSQKRSYMGSSLYNSKPSSYLKQTYLNTLNVEDIKSSNKSYNYENYHKKPASNKYSSFTDLNRELDDKIDKIRKKYIEASDILVKNKNGELRANYGRENKDSSYLSYEYSNSRYKKPIRAYDTSIGKFDDLSTNYELPTNYNAYDVPRLSKNHTSYESNTRKMRSSMIGSYMNPRSRKLISIHDYQ